MTSFEKLSIEKSVPHASVGPGLEQRVCRKAMRSGLVAVRADPFDLGLKQRDPGGKLIL